MFRASGQCALGVLYHTNTFPDTDVLDFHSYRQVLGKVTFTTYVAAKPGTSRLRRERVTARLPYL